MLNTRNKNTSQAMLANKIVIQMINIDIINFSFFLKNIIIIFIIYLTIIKIKIFCQY
jgi:hypothetical protein